MEGWRGGGEERKSLSVAWGLLGSGVGARARQCLSKVSARESSERRVCGLFFWACFWALRCVGVGFDSGLWLLSTKTKWSRLQGLAGIWLRWWWVGALGALRALRALRVPGGTTAGYEDKGIKDTENTGRWSGRRWDGWANKGGGRWWEVVVGGRREARGARCETGKQTGLDWARAKWPKTMSCFLSRVPGWMVRGYGEWREWGMENGKDGGGL